MESFNCAFPAMTNIHSDLLPLLLFKPEHQLFESMLCFWLIEIVFQREVQVMMASIALLYTFDLVEY